MAGLHHRVDAHEFGSTPGVGDGQGGLACCDSWGHKELDTTEQLNWTDLSQASHSVYTVSNVIVLTSVWCNTLYILD